MTKKIGQTTSASVGAANAGEWTINGTTVTISEGGTVTAGDGTEASITVDENGTVTITIGNETYTATTDSTGKISSLTDENGKDVTPSVKLTATESTAKGTYTYTDGDGNHTIIAVGGKIIDVTDGTDKGEKVGTYTITGGTVSGIFGGNDFTATTDDKGCIASITIGSTKIPLTRTSGDTDYTLKAEDNPVTPAPETPAADTAYHWTFADLKTVAVEPVKVADETAANAISTAALLAEKTAEGTTFADVDSETSSGSTSQKFLIKGDATYTSSVPEGAAAGLDAKIKAIGVSTTTGDTTTLENYPILYNRYLSAQTPGSTDALLTTLGLAQKDFTGAIETRDDFFVVENVQGPFKVAVTYASNGSSTKSGRHAYVKVGATEYKDAANENQVPGAISQITLTYAGTDTQTVTVGATGLARFYDIKITPIEGEVKEDQAAPADTSFTASACTTSDQNDGKITISGIDDVTTLEYRLSSASAYTSVTNASITGLAAGTYQFRFKETSTHEASPAVSVEVGRYVVTAAVADVTYNWLTADGAQSIVAATANATTSAEVKRKSETEDGYGFIQGSSDLSETPAILIHIPSDVNNSKVASSTGNNGRLQLNEGAELYIPVSAGSVVTVTSYNSATNFTLAGIYAYAGTVSYTAASAGYVKLYAPSQVYLTKITVTNVKADDSTAHSATSTDGIQLATLVAQEAKTIALKDGLAGSTVEANIGDKGTEYIATVTEDGRTEIVEWTTTNPAVAAVDFTDTHCTVTPGTTVGTATITAKVGSLGAVSFTVSLSEKPVTIAFFSEVKAGDEVSHAASNSGPSVWEVTAGGTPGGDVISRLTPAIAAESTSGITGLMYTTSSAVGYSTEKTFFSYTFTVKALASVQLNKLTYQIGNSATDNFYPYTTYQVNSTAAVEKKGTKSSSKKMTEAVDLSSITLSEYDTITITIAVKGSKSDSFASGKRFVLGAVELSKK